MGDKTGIEWTDATWNPIVGCSVVSPGCTNCYAMPQAARVERMGGRAGAKYAGLTDESKAGAVWNGTTRFSEQALEQPRRWKKPRRVFVNSMGDLFHENVPDEWIDRAFATIQATRRHTYQILTKRAARARDYLTRLYREADGNNQKWFDRGFVWPLTADQPIPLPNVWHGVSIEDQTRAKERATALLDTPAAVRFASCEPLLGPVDFAGRLPDWVICGGESGPNARTMHPDWVRSLRDQCADAGVPFFFKQWGGRTPKAGGRLLDGRTHDEFPESTAGGGQ